MRDALVVIDLQNWMFRTPCRQAQLPGILGNVARLVEAYRAAGRRIFDVRTIHKADRSTWSQQMLAHDYACLIEDTDDAAHVSGYALAPEAVEIRKTRHSAFVNTDFHHQLAADEIEHLTLVGVFVDGCVGLTAADAAQRDLHVTFVGDAIGHTDPRYRKPILDWLCEDYGLQIVDTNAALAALQV